MINVNRLYRAFGHAFNGIMHAFKNEQNFRIHLVIGFAVIILSIILDVSPFEQGLLGVVMVLVICAEMVNTAIENMVDLITKDYREEAKIAKDVGSGMVLLTAICAVIIGLLVFTPYLLKLL